MISEKLTAAIIAKTKCTTFQNEMYNFHVFCTRKKRVIKSHFNCL